MLMVVCRILYTNSLKTHCKNLLLLEYVSGSVFGFQRNKRFCNNSKPCCYANIVDLLALLEPSMCLLAVFLKCMSLYSGSRVFSVSCASLSALQFYSNYINLHNPPMYMMFEERVSVVLMGLPRVNYMLKRQGQKAQKLEYGISNPEDAAVSTVHKRINAKITYHRELIRLIAPI